MKKLFALFMILASVFIISCENEPPAPEPEVFNVKLIVSGSDIREYKVKDGDAFSFPELDDRFDGAIAYVALTEDDRCYFLDDKPVITEDIIFSVLWSDHTFEISDDGILTGVKGTDPVLAIPHKVNGKEIKELGNELLKNRSDIKRVYIQDGIVKIGDRAFNSYKIQEIHIPSSVATVGEWAFYCPDLTRIIIDGPSIPDWGDAWNEGFIGTIITAGEFIEQDGIVYAKVQDNDVTVLTVWDYNGKWMNVTIPSSVNGIPVRSIASGAFKKNQKVRTLTISEGIESIGAKAFSGSQVHDIKLPSTLIELEPYALSGMVYVTELVLPDSLTVLPKYALSGNSNLVNIVFPANLEVIGEGAFSNTGDSRTKIVIPDSVKSIEARAFSDSQMIRIELPAGLSLHASQIFHNWHDYQTISFATRSDMYGSDGGWEQNCSAQFEFRDDFKTAEGFSFGHTHDGNLMLVDIDADKITEVVSIPETAVDLNGVELPVVAIGNSIFENNTTVKEVKIPKSVVSIGSKLFRKCTNLTTVNLPEGLKEIPVSAFDGCGITSIKIPSTVTEIGDNAFSFTKFTTITIPASVTTIGEMAFIQSDITEIVFEKDSALKTIDESAFQACYSIKNLTLPDGLNKICRNAFNSCNGLETISIPASVKTIGNSAFSVVGVINPAKMTIAAGADRTGWAENWYTGQITIVE